MDTQCIQNMLKKSINYVKLLSIVCLIGVLYNNDLFLFSDDVLVNSKLIYTFVLIFFVSCVVYRKRRMLKIVASLPADRAETLLGLLLCCFSLTLYLVGSYTLQPITSHLLSLPVFVVGIILFMFNFRTLKTLLLPVLLVVLLVPLDFEPIYSIAQTITNMTSDFSLILLKSIGVPAVLSADAKMPAILLQTISSEFTFFLDSSYGGVYSIIIFTLVSSFAAYYLRGPIQKRMLVFFMGLPLMFCLNTLRIVAVVFLSFNFKIELTTGLFQIFNLFLLILSGLFILVFASQKFLKLRVKSKLPPEFKELVKIQSKRKLSIDAHSSSWDLAKIVTLVLLTSLLLVSNFSVFALKENSVEIVSSSAVEGVESQLFLPELPNYGLLFQYRNFELESELGLDKYLVYSYVPDDLSKKVVNVFVEISNTSISFDKWQDTFTYWVTTQSYDEIEIQLMDDPVINAGLVSFQETYNNSLNLGVYWKESSLFLLNSSVATKNVRISLLTATDVHSEKEILENSQLIPIAEEIVSFWSSPKAESEIVLPIIKLRNELLGIALGSFILAIFIMAQKYYSRKKSLVALYQKLSSKSEKQILFALSKTRYPTNHRIALTYSKVFNDKLDIDKLINTLKQAENIGLIKSDVTTFEDVPLYVWHFPFSFKLKL